MKRIVSLLLGVILAVMPLVATGENTAEAGVYYQKTWLSNPGYGYRDTIAALVMTNDPGQDVKTEEDIKAEIRFYPFSAETGLYATGEGEAAGDRVEIQFLSENRINYTARLKEPGKYVFQDTAYYLLDSDQPVLAGLRAELDGIVADSTDTKEKKMAQKLHDWVCKRVSPVFPEEDAERLAVACTDPMNALITGYACAEAYAPLLNLLLSASGLRCMTVCGTVNEAESCWSLARLDDEWCWTDSAMDDLNDKKGNKYLEKDDKTMAKDHTLRAEDQLFTDQMIRESVMDNLFAGTLRYDQLKYYPKVGINYLFTESDGPVWTIGDSATVTFHMYGNKMEELKGMTTEEFLNNFVYYFPWMEEEDKPYYYSWNVDLYNTAETPYEMPPRTELITIENMAEDYSTFTLTFQKPGYYRIGDGYFDTYVYVISPEQKEAAEMAAEMDAAVEKAKGAATEKEAAKMLFQWIRRRVKYNYAAKKWKETWNSNDATERDVATAWEAIGALIYGKAVCGGYSAIYHALLCQAGIRDIDIGGSILPEYEDHAWNLNRLDGVWSHTDVTWDRFCWTPEKMAKDHEALLDPVLTEICFGSTMDYLADQLEEDHKTLKAIPARLRFLPRRIEDYDFPEKLPQFMQADVTLEGKEVTLNLSARARILFGSVGDEGSPTDDWERKAPVEKTLTRSMKYPESFQVELRSDPEFPFQKKPCQWILLDYTDGELTRARYRYVVLDKAGIYADAGYNSRYHYYEYDENMNPTGIGYYMTFEGAALDLRIFFDTEGNVDYYKVKYSSFMDDIKSSWQGTPDNPLTVLNGTEIRDTTEADPRIWDPVWFEK